MMKILCVIPARYASTRLRGKPLVDIAGKPMVCRVYDRVIQAKSFQKEDVLVATDDERILQAVEKNNGRAIMTSKEHRTGTDRLAEVARKFEDVDVIVNVQGDEPLIEASLIDELVAEFYKDETLQMATVATPITEREEQLNPNNVKVVLDKQNFALYFSRSLLPYPRVAGCAKVLKHIGIYAYRREFLLKYASLPPTDLEQAESLEQLRALENGYKIKVILTNSSLVGVDTAEDLAHVIQIYHELEKGVK